MESITFDGTTRLDGRQVRTVPSSRNDPSSFFARVSEDRQHLARIADLLDAAWELAGRINHKLTRDGVQRALGTSSRYMIQQVGMPPRTGQVIPQQLCERCEAVWATTECRRFLLCGSCAEALDPPPDPA